MTYDGWLQWSDLRVTNCSVDKSDQVSCLKPLGSESNVPNKTVDKHTHFSAAVISFIFYCYT